jgi:hypothetical protein
VEDRANRYRAVDARSSRLLRAAVEDREERQLVYVATPAMACFLADALNGLDRGGPLPPAGDQHRPRRFQLTHDSLGLESGARVVYMNRSKGRLVASAADDDAAERVAQILNHVGYPMGDAGLIPTVGAIRPAPSRLPKPEVVPTPSSVRRGWATAYVAWSALPLAAFVAALAFLGWPYAVAAFGFFALFVIAVRATLVRSLRGDK